MAIEDHPLPEEPKEYQWRIFLSQEEHDALEVIRNKAEYRNLKISKRAALRQALISYAGRDFMSDLMARIETVLKNMGSERNIIDTVIAPKTSNRPVGRPPAAGMSMTDKIERGKQVCALLGGTVMGGSCSYQKHEVTASGKGFTNHLTEPLDRLTDEDVRTQYEPSREAFEAAIESKGRAL